MNNKPHLTIIPHKMRLFLFTDSYLLKNNKLIMYLYISYNNDYIKVYICV